MIKSELVQKIADKNPHLYHRDVERIINTILDQIIGAMKEGDRVELRGFGAFSVKSRKARTGRNPRTGEAVEVTPKRVPFFKTGKELRERLNGGTVSLRRILRWAIGLPIAIVVVLSPWPTGNGSRFPSIRSRAMRPSPPWTCRCGRCSSAAFSSASSPAGLPAGSRKANGGARPRSAQRTAARPGGNQPTAPRNRDRLAA